MVYTDGKCACIVFMLNECTYGRASLGRKVHSNDNFPCNFGLLEKCSIRKDGVFCVMWNFYSFFFFIVSSLRNTFFINSECLCIFSEVDLNRCTQVVL